MSGVEGARRIESLIQLHRYADARSLLSRKIAAAPDDSHLHALLAEAHLGLEANREAVAAAREAVRLDPNSPEAFSVWSRSLMSYRRYDESREAALRWIALAPTDANAHVRLAIVCANIEGARTEAEGAARRARELAPDAWLSHFAVGYVAQAHGHFRTARKAYRRALSVDPGATPARHNLALVAGHWNPVEGARGLAAVLAEQPDEQSARSSLDDMRRRALSLVAWTCGVVYVLTVIVSAFTDIFWAHAIGSTLMFVLAPAAVIRAWRQLPNGVRLHARSSSPTLFALDVVRLSLTLATAEVLLLAPATVGTTFEGETTVALVVVLLGWLAYLAAKRLLREERWW